MTLRGPAVVLLLGVLLAGCGAPPRPAPKPKPTPALPTPSTANPGGALAGFLHAAADQDNIQALTWLATPDADDLNQLLKVYTDFGSSGGGFFWEVEKVTATGERQVDATHADVALTGPITWCLGRSVSDPAATCSQVNGVPGRQDTYAAIFVAGEWKADVDVDASSSLDHNPLASPTATEPTPTPT